MMQIYKICIYLRNFNQQTMKTEFYIGIFFTIIFGLPSLILFLKQKKTKLYFIKDKEVNLQEDLLKNFENLKITYDNIEITDKITYLKGHVICAGDKDITNALNEIEIFNTDYNWLNFKITSKSNGLVIDSAIIDGKAIVKAGLFKITEYFSFEGIIKNKIEESITKEVDLTFSHRIPNIPTIKGAKKSELSNFSLYIGVFFSFMSLFLLNEMSRFYYSDVEVFDSTTDKKIEIDTKHLISTEFDKIVDKANNDYWGIELLLIHSKNYDYTYTTEYVYEVGKKDKQKTVNIYIKRNDYLTFGFIVFALFVLIVGIAMLYIFVLNYNHKKIFKYVIEN